MCPAGKPVTPLLASSDKYGAKRSTPPAPARGLRLLRLLVVLSGYASYVSEPSSWGWAVVGLCAAFGAYLAAGYAHATKTSGRRGINAVPHAAFFLQLQSLVHDGVAYSKGARPRSGGGGYERAGSGREEKRSSKKGKKEKGAKKQAKESSGKQGGAAQRGGGRPALAPAPAPAPPATAAGTPAAGGTAAGDGGRWVHVK